MSTSMMMSAICSNCNEESIADLGSLGELDDSKRLTTWINPSYPIVVKLCDCKLEDGIDTREIIVRISVYSMGDDNQEIGWLICSLSDDYSSDDCNERDVDNWGERDDGCCRSKVQLCLDDLFVKSSFRKAGVATQLMKQFTRLRKGSCDPDIPVAMTIASYPHDCVMEEGTDRIGNLVDDRMTDEQLRRFYSKFI